MRALLAIALLIGHPWPALALADITGKANGNATHPAPPVNVNITITRDQVDANMDAVFNRVAARQAADRSPTRH